MLPLLSACAPDAPDAADGPEVLDVRVEDVPDQALLELVDVELDRPAPVEVACAAGDDRLVWRGDDARTTHEVRAVGLLADTTFACTATPEGGEPRRFELTTSNLPALLPELTITGETDGWTLFNHEAMCGEGYDPEKLVVVDEEGRVRWYHVFDFSGADLEARWLGGDRVLVGGRNVAPTELDLRGEETWSSGLEGEFHHDVDVVEDDVLALSAIENTDGLETWEGFEITRVRRDGTIAWSFDSQAAVDAGTLPAGTDDDPWHANDVSWIDDGVWVSLHFQSQIAHLDTATGEIDWKLGEGGDFTLTEGRWFSGLHAPEVDGDRLLLYDNRAFTEEQGHTRVVEYELDVAARTARQTWEWSEPAWHEPAFGDVDRLPDGRVLVTMGHAACWYGEDDRVSALVEVDPETGDVTWRADLGRDDTLYRAQRVDACEMFGACGG